MANPIVVTNVSQTIAPTPNTLQKTGAVLSQGGTTTATGTRTLITQMADLTAILAAPLAVISIYWAGGVAIVTTNVAHGITTSDTFLTTIAGATSTAYNGTWLATATGASTFTYALASDGGTSPATGTITYTPRNVAELVADFTTFFNQGSQLACYVLELGAGEPAAGVTELTTLINASPQFFYAYLVPQSWDALASFLTLAGSFENTTSKTYFYVSTTAGTYTSYTKLMKSVFWMLQAPLAPTTEVTVAGAFWNLLNYAPSSVNKVSPFEYSYLFGVTPYPTTGNQALLTTVKAAGGSYVGTGSEGGISDAIIIGGTYADGRPVNYWYSVDWVQINCDLAVSNAVINGSNNPINPLYYNQDGINRLQQVITSTLNNGVSYGLVLFNVKPTALVQAAFLQQFDAEAFVGYTVVNAEPFIPYSQENPSNFKIGLYGGFSVVFTPNRGFDQIIININVTDFVAQ